MGGSEGECEFTSQAARDSGLGKDSNTVAALDCVSQVEGGDSRRGQSSSPGLVLAWLSTLVCPLCVAAFSADVGSNVFFLP